MKKLLAILLAVMMVLGTTACSDMQDMEKLAEIAESVIEEAAELETAEENETEIAAETNAEAEAKSSETEIVDKETANAETDVTEETPADKAAAKETTAEETTTEKITANETTDFVYGKPDYSKNEYWAIKNASEGRDYDLVFIYGTSIGEPTMDNGIGDISDGMRAAGINNYILMGSQLSAVESSKGNKYVSNIYIPLYRQTALNYALAECKTHDDLMNNDRSHEPYADYKEALDYYFENYNKNAERPFVIAGHSQGGAMVQVVLEEYFINGGHKDYLKNMIAMYSLGYGVSKKWFDGLDRRLDGREVLHFAEGADDYNCMISWNTEGPNADPEISDILLPDEPYDTYVINPLNWKTDETPATRYENLGVLISNPDKEENNPYSPDYIISTKFSDLFNAQINLERGTVMCSEHKGTYISIPPYGPIWGGQSLHMSDGPGFYVNMNQNLGDRIDAFLGK